MATDPDNRFARFTPLNHSAPIWISSTLCLIFSFFMLLVRMVFVKRRLFGVDDIFLTVAQLVGLGMWISLFVSLDSGLGQALHLLNEREIISLNQSYFASRVLLFLALACSKACILVFIQGIFSFPTVLRAGNITIAVALLWGLSSALLASVRCADDHIEMVQENYHCAHDVLRIKAITVIDVITELIIAALPIIPLRGINMPTKQKFLVAFAFSFRIPNIAISVMHYVSYAHFIRSGQRGVAISPPVVLQSILLSYNLMSATIPALKGFMSHFITGGVGYTGVLSTTQGSSGGASGNNHELRSVSKNAGVARLLTDTASTGDTAVLPLKRREASQFGKRGER